MGRRGRSFFGLMLVGCGAVALYFWRNKRVRDYTRALLAPAGDRVREFVRKTLRKQAAARSSGSKPREVITGLTAPEARPLSSLEQLLDWNPDPAADPDAPFCRTYNAPLMLPPASGFTASRGPNQPPGVLGSGSAATPFASAASGTATTAHEGGGGGRPRLLVCHDMMGGYLEDRWVQGAADPGFFRLWQWDQIDVFIYFSHHLVTVPPPGWTAAAHRNGVRVLGTLITEEWAEGRPRCETLLASAAAARRTADTLAALAAHQGFDGWLVNIENGLRRDLLPHLITFVGHLRARMAAVVGPHALVIWYDAITSEGRLAWQDGLTRLNAPFFDSADALFVNYRWREGAPQAVAEAAGSRAADVYMGVDVFGRGSYGGGKANCPVALAAARAAGVSAALFAPGWVFEEFPRDSFEPRQEAFWARIREVWPTRPAQLQRLPLATSFNVGAGRAVWLEGRRVSSAPWYNLAAQDVVAATSPCPGSQAWFVPSGPGPAPPPPGPLLVRPSQQLAFCGGACLALSLSIPLSIPLLSEPGASGAEAADGRQRRGEGPGPWLHQLYTANLPVPAAGLDLSYTVACGGSSRVAVLLRTAPLRLVEGGHEAVVAVAAAGGAVGGGGGGGVAVGPWGPGDEAVKEALRRAGYTCVSSTAVPTGATTCPLPDQRPTATAPTAAATAIPAGLPWVTCAAHLPPSLICTASACSGLAAVVITAVGVACFRSTAGTAGGGTTSGSAAAGQGLASAVGGTGGGGGRSSARGSTTGFAGGTAPGPVAAAEGGEGDSFLAFLGRLVLREASAGCSGALPQATDQPPPPMISAGAAPPPPPPPPLSGGCCFRIRWSRPVGTTAVSLRGSITSLNGAVKAAAGAAGTSAAVVDPRVSGELVESVEGDDEDEDWDDSRGEGGGAATGGSPVKVAAPGGGGGDDDDDDEEGDVNLGVGAVGDAADMRLLTCELSWEPQFDGYGTPRHRSYHVWAHFSESATAAGSMSAAAAAAAATASSSRTTAATAAGGGLQLPKVPSPTKVAGAGGAADNGESAWELLHPDWSGAIWAGEAFVARYRLVELEVPAGARSVTLLVQPVMWQSGELGPLQPMACLAVPAAL